MSQSAAVVALQYEPVNPEGTEKGEEYLCSNSHQTAATPYGEHQGSSGCEKHSMLAPDRNMHMRGVISTNPDSCIFPYIEKC